MIAKQFLRMAWWHYSFACGVDAIVGDLFDGDFLLEAAELEATFAALDAAKIPKALNVGRERLMIFVVGKGGRSE